MLKSKISTSVETLRRIGHDLGWAAKGVFRLKVDIVTLRGPIRGSDEVVTLLYVGRGANLVYFKKNFFSEVDVVASETKTLLTYKACAELAQERADVVFLDIGWPYHGFINKSGDYLELPDWVNMIVPMAEDWDDVVKRFRQTARKNDLRLIRRNKYRCEPSNEPDVIRNFYDDFYVPFVSSRHAGEVVLSSRELVERRAREGTILQVFNEDDDVITQGLVYPEDGILHFLWTGMPAIYVENMPEAAVSALNYFCFRYAFDQSMDAVNLMSTRSFPTDGVYQFKRRWGAILEDNCSPSSLLFKPVTGSKQAAKFCAQFPMVARRDGSTELVMCSTAPDLTEQDIDRMLSSYFFDGIDRMTVVHKSDQSTPIACDYDSKHGSVQIIACDLAEFAQSYTDDSLQKIAQGAFPITDPGSLVA